MTGAKPANQSALIEEVLGSLAAEVSKAAGLARVAGKAAGMVGASTGRHTQLQEAASTSSRAQSRAAMAGTVLEMDGAGSIPVGHRPNTPRSIHGSHAPRPRVLRKAHATPKWRKQPAALKAELQ